MIRYFRRHETDCKLKGEKGLKCPIREKGATKGKNIQCPVWVVGTLRDGTPVRKQSINSRTLPLPEEIAAWEVGYPIGKPLDPNAIPGVQPPKKALSLDLQEAVETYLLSKATVSADRQRKLKLLLKRLVAFAKLHGKTSIREVNDQPLLTSFVATWTGTNGTKKRDQQNLRGFFRYSAEVTEWIDKNKASTLASIKDERPQTEVFTLDEMRDILAALPLLEDEYGRCGQGIALQTTAFVYLMKYTGLSIGDVAKLEKSHLDGDEIFTYRGKTGEDVYTKIPPFVVDALNAAPHDSDKYFFWSGKGKIHTRTSKWGERIQRLFVLAKVRLVKTEWTNKALKLKENRALAAKGEKRIFSEADPRWFRHTLARDMFLDDCTMEDVARQLGNTVEMCRKHYSRWDKERQASQNKKTQSVWEADEHYLSKVKASS